MGVKNTNVETRMIRSRIQLLVKYPFYGTLALSLKLVEDFDIPTAGVDGVNFYYNPEFIEKLSEAELNWITAHEIMHCALGHIWRRGSRTHEKFNIACDYAIHSILKSSESSDFKMPAGCLYDKKFDNHSSEEIYDMLPDMPKAKMNGSGGNGKQGGDPSKGNSGNNNPGTIDDHSKWENSKVQEGGKEKQREWMEKMINAAEVAEAKKAGSTPGQITRLIGKIKKPQKNWKQLLAEFIQFEVFDYGFLPPDKRMYGFSDVLMPDYNETTEKVQDIVFVVDTSGSIGDRELVAVFSELVGMMQQFSSGVKGHIVYADSAVAAVYDFESVDDILKAKPAGGGGTDMEVAIKYSIEQMDKNEWDVAGVCVLTDGYTPYNMTKDEIPFNVLWLITSNTEEISDSRKPPYGTVATLKV